jgi:hypothetical protein
MDKKKNSQEKKKLPTWALATIIVVVVAVVIVIVVVLSVELTKSSPTPLNSVFTGVPYQQQMCAQSCIPVPGSNWTISADNAMLLTCSSTGVISMTPSNFQNDVNQQWIFQIVSTSPQLNQGIYNIINSEFNGFSLCSISGAIGTCLTSVGDTSQQWTLIVLSSIAANPFLSFALVNRFSGLALTITPNYSVFLTAPDNSVLTQQLIGNLLTTALIPLS